MKSRAQPNPPPQPSSYAPRAGASPRISLFQAIEHLTTCQILFEQEIYRQLEALRVHQDANHNQAMDLLHRIMLSATSSPAGAVPASPSSLISPPIPPPFPSPSLASSSQSTPVIIPFLTFPHLLLPFFLPRHQPPLSHLYPRQASCFPHLPPLLFLSLCPFTSFHLLLLALLSLTSLIPLLRPFSPSIFLLLPFKPTYLAILSLASFSVPPLKSILLPNLSTSFLLPPPPSIPRSLSPLSVIHPSSFQLPLYLLHPPPPSSNFSHIYSSADLFFPLHRRSHLFPS